MTISIKNLEADGVEVHRCSNIIQRYVLDSILKELSATGLCHEYKKSIRSGYSSRYAHGFFYYTNIAKYGGDFLIIADWETDCTVICTYYRIWNLEEFKINFDRIKLSIMNF